MAAVQRRLERQRINQQTIQLRRLMHTVGPHGLPTQMSRIFR
jgi:hypothetical protein